MLITKILRVIINDAPPVHSTKIIFYIAVIERVVPEQWFSHEQDRNNESYILSISTLP